jgi:hypothetical protein
MPERFTLSFEDTVLKAFSPSLAVMAVAHVPPPVSVDPSAAMLTLPTPFVVEPKPPMAM